jgi:quercetin dioxygenase-like cupin family protein
MKKMKKTLIVSVFISLLWGCNTTKTTQTMNLKALHTEEKAVQTHLLFTPTADKVISVQIAKGEQLKEHVSEVPALFVCIDGKAIYSDENGTKETLEAGNYVFIEANVKHKVEAIKESNFLLIK